VSLQVIPQNIKKEKIEHFLHTSIRIYGHVFAETITTEIYQRSLGRRSNLNNTNVKNTTIFSGFKVNEKNFIDQK
jgi:hypothetical protein